MTGTENQIDYDAIEKLAKAATPGPWVWKETGDWGPKLDSGSVRKTVLDCWVASDDSGSIQVSDEDAAYIAALDPATVHALVRKARQRDEAEKEIEARIGSVGSRSTVSTEDLRFALDLLRKA